MGASYREVYRGSSLAERVRRVYGRGGIAHLLASVLRLVWRSVKFRCIAAWYAVRAPGMFTFDGKTYRYLYRFYNTTWQNERCVEVPVALAAVRSTRGRVLEVGHVLGHYAAIAHDVLDKYEDAPGIIRQDIVDFAPEKPYDFIVSVSTIEHVGFDEDKQDPKKIPRALAHLRERCLAPGGTMLVTLPLGYNPDLDRLLHSGAVSFDERHCMHRDRRGFWQERSWDEVRNLEYDKSVPTARGVVFGIIKKSAST
jgi:SAM-dependent methyltransferase